MYFQCTAEPSSLNSVLSVYGRAKFTEQCILYTVRAKLTEQCTFRAKFTEKCTFNVRLELSSLRSVRSVYGRAKFTEQCTFSVRQSRVYSTVYVQCTVELSSLNSARSVYTKATFTEQRTFRAKFSEQCASLRAPHTRHRWQCAALPARFTERISAVKAPLTPRLKRRQGHNTSKQLTCAGHHVHFLLLSFFAV